ncbi:hypothetical protein [Streptomyces sp. NBC_00120]|uniref:hypothetical protein n=1 Tax=Streptomyces sp. NBC_00120 TaxID=2975660 RepID=UPI002256EB57|nr:hypothetical protein [Streptomyces sp. NBC_00120]MCX5326276.1 hypothetical protein [Streptomyces sp. NBC_00120]
MDLQDLGSIAAAVGVPAAVLVGWWQARGAKASARAGIAQAEATYQAALDAVRAEASTAHAQWRRGIQREAYAAFLLASQKLTDSSRRLLRASEDGASIDDLQTTVQEARNSLLSASLVVSLEGPDAVARAGNVVRDYSLLIVSIELEQALLNILRKKLAADQDVPRWPHFQVRAQEALGQLEVTADESLDTYDPAVERQARAAASQALVNLSIFTSDERGVLLDAAKGGDPTDLVDYASTHVALPAEQKKFIAAARAELDFAGPGPGEPSR